MPEAVLPALNNASLVANWLNPLSESWPRVFEAVCETWPSRTWDEARLEALLPTVRASFSASNVFPRDGERPCPTAQVAMREFLRRVRGVDGHLKEHVYCHGVELPLAAEADCPLPILLRREQIARRSLWISGSKAMTPLHYDLQHVLLCQLQGWKRIFLLAPRLRPAGRSFPALGPQERLARTSRHALPLAVAAEGISMELRAGNALLIPAGWWHEVESFSADEDGVGCCVSLGHNWPQTGDAIQLFASYATATKYPILTQGEVLAQFYGADKVCGLPNKHDPVF